MEIDYEKPQKKIPKGSCYERAVKMLSRREHSVGEMKQKLLDKGYEWQIVDETLARLVNLRFLDDRHFAYEWIRYRAEASKWGRKRIENDLKQKKVHENFIAEGFYQFESGSEERVDEAYDWQQQATDLMLRKYGAWDFSLDEAVEQANGWQERKEAMKEIQKQTAKRINFLLRRGFSSEQASKALNESKNV